MPLPTKRMDGVGLVAEDETVVALLAHAVLNVFGLRAYEQVRFFDALTVVASVAHEQVRGEGGVVA